MKLSTYIVAACAILGFLCSSIGTLSAQTRVAVFPFRNTNGDIAYNERSYQLSDSISSMLMADARKEGYTLLPPDSVAAVLASLNLDPTNPQYESDMWKAATMLNIQKVITGTFNVKYNKIFVNASVYSVQTKLADMNHRAQSVYRPYEKALETVSIIVQQVAPALTENK